MFLRLASTLSLLAASLSFSDAVGLPRNATTYDFDHGQDHRRLALLPHPTFDIYMLQLFWWPGHCAASTSGGGIPLCDAAAMPAEWKSNLVVHGLWPSYSVDYMTANPELGAGPDGLKNKDCVGADYVSPQDPAPAAAAKGGKKKAKASAPNYFPVLTAAQAAGTPHTLAAQLIFPGRGVSSNPDFYSHEYTKHGRCSGLTQEEYFAATLAHATPLVGKLEALAEAGKPVQGAQIVGLFEHMATIGCHAKTKLWFVNVCFSFDKDAEHGIGDQVFCPQVQAVGKCGAAISL